MTIAFLGPEGTFTDAAAQTIAQAGESLVPGRDITEVLRLVADGEVDRGVVPIENTLEGAVAATLDALAFDGLDLTIEAELELPVTLVLAGRGQDLTTVTEVRSHPVPLAGCRKWLAANLPDADLVPAASTARAAIRAAEDETGSIAAIVNPLAAQLYGLDIVGRGVADGSGNTTRFVVVGTAVPPPTGWDKTSVVVFIDVNEPGALLTLLEIFAERGLNLTKIESRPTKHELGDYCFFLDVEGHLVDERVGDALAAVQRTQRDIRILGSYRRSGARDSAEAERIARDDRAYRASAAWLTEWRTRVAD